MTPEGATPDKRSPCDGDAKSEQHSLTAEQLAALDDAAKQDVYRREYFAQLKRRACPGCGESDDHF